MQIINPEITIAQKAKRAIYDQIGTENLEANFQSFLKGLPSNIIQNGLVQTLAFIRGKSDQKYKKLYATLNQFFCEHFSSVDTQITINTDILKYLVDNLDDLNYYNLFQEKILSFTIWLKRFSLAFAPDNN